MNRTRDGRVISNRMRIDKEEFGQVLQEIKNEMGWSWKQFAEPLGVSAYTLRHDWRNTDTTIPEPVLEEIMQLSSRQINIKDKTSAWWGQKKGGENSVTVAQGAMPDHINLDFGEFYGAMLGDGVSIPT